MGREVRRHALLPLLLVLGGCATVVIPPPPARPETPVQAQERRAKASRPAYNLAGYPPAVRDGYIDGCESAKRTQYARKDAKRFADDGQYSMGWNDGFSICSRK